MQALILELFVVVHSFVQEMNCSVFCHVYRKKTSRIFSLCGCVVKNRQKPVCASATRSLPSVWTTEKKKCWPTVFVFWLYHKMSLEKLECLYVCIYKLEHNNHVLFLGLGLMSFCLWKWSQTSPTTRWAGLVSFPLIHFSGSKHWLSLIMFWIVYICSE